MTVRTDDIAEALEGIRRAGPLTPTRVVRSAAKPESILHPIFEWDDARAGHQHRLWQARQLLASRVTTVENGNTTLRAYIHVPSRDGEGEYVPVQTIVHHLDQLQAARDVAVRALESAEANIAELDEAVRVFGAPERTADRQAKTTRARALVEDARSELAGV